MMRFILSFALLGTVHAAHSQSEVREKIDSLFGQSTITKKPGGVVCVLRDGQVIYRKAIGMADIAKGTPNSFELKYDLASIAKQFTAMCIALLEEQEKLSTDDQLSKFYPEFSFSNTIKIRNLIDHTSGIREAYVLATLSGKANLKGELKEKYNTKEYLMTVLRREKDLNFEPGTELAYTNINYILLADLVERISNQPFHRFADSAIFQPLQMKNTFYRFERDMAFPGEAKGYLVKPGNKYKSVKATGGILGDGKMVSTIDDLVKWEQNFRNNKLGISGQALTDKLYTSSTLNNSKPTQYGYGLWSREYRGLQTISHGGDDGRFTSFILKFPDQGIVIICLSNSSLYNNTESSAYQIADILLKDQFGKPKNAPVAYSFISTLKEDLGQWGGLYKRINEGGLAQLRKISLQDSLYLSSDYYGKGLTLKSVSKDFFVATNRFGNQIKLQFKRDSSGISFQEQFQNNEPFLFERIEQVKFSNKDFSGDYVNPSTLARLKVKFKRDKLVAKKGIIKIPLISFGPNQFYAIRNDALFIFQRNSNNRVVSLKVNANDFRNFVFERVR